MLANLEQFAQFQFPKLPRDRVAVYVVALGGSSMLKPSYVGKTQTSLKGRMGHYLTASKDTAADFVVGTAITILQDMGKEVIVCYRPSDSASLDESQLIKCYSEQGFYLLNFFPKHSGLINCPRIDVKSLKADAGRKSACEQIRKYIDRLI